MIFGEIIHNLRSALDHLVASLVDGYGRSVGRNHSFPIYCVEADFIADVSARRKKRGPGPLEGIPLGGNIWTLIEDAQPYKRGNAAADHPFSVLNDFWNEDKHRTLNAAHVLPEPANFVDTVTLGDALCTSIRPHFVRGTPAKDGTDLITFGFSPGSPEPDMQVKRPLPLDIAFGDGQGLPSDLGVTHALIYNLAKACERAFP